MYDKKSDDAYKTISEVSKIVGVTATALRFWEKSFKHLRPCIITGIRYYSPADIDNLRAIRTLLYEQGYTIAGAVKYLKKNRAQPLVINTSSQHTRLRAVLEQVRAAEALLKS
jgi:DNA-binding transcriptional MerR regulator